MRPTPTQAQQQTIIDVIRDALRAAATAPTVFDALDLTGAALLKIAADLKAAETA